MISILSKYYICFIHSHRFEGICIIIQIILTDRSKKKKTYKYEEFILCLIKQWMWCNNILSTVFFFFFINHLEITQNSEKKSFSRVLKFTQGFFSRRVVYNILKLQNSICSVVHHITYLYAQNCTFKKRCTESINHFLQRTFIFQQTLGIL